MIVEDRMKNYMKKLEMALSDMERLKRRRILDEVKENINDKAAEYRSTKSSERPLKDSEMEMILDNFGDPEEIALNYKMHAPEDSSGGSKTLPWKPILITAAIMTILLLSTVTASAGSPSVVRR